MDLQIASDYIPQQPPILVVDHFWDCSESGISTDFRIPEKHSFVDKGLLSEAGLLENIAQSCAARIGWLNRDKPLKIGVIGGITKLEIVRFPKVGELLQTTVQITTEIGSATVAHAIIHSNNEEILNCDMKVFISEETFQHN